MITAGISFWRKTKILQPEQQRRFPPKGNNSKHRAKP
jgi:hypothetical protein